MGKGNKEEVTANNEEFIETAEAQTAMEAKMEIDKYAEKQIEVLKKTTNNEPLITGDNFLRSVVKGTYTGGNQQTEKYASKRLSRHHIKSARFIAEADPQEN